MLVLCTLTSHLKVHGHSPICSLFSNQSERHIMVPSSGFINNDLLSLRRGHTKQTKLQSVHLIQFQRCFLLPNLNTFCQNLRIKIKYSITKYSKVFLHCKTKTTLILIRLILRYVCMCDAFCIYACILILFCIVLCIWEMTMLMK